MDFQAWKNKHNNPKASFRDPWMGLDGIVCEKPVFWCRLHEVWLSEEDTVKKKCAARQTPDMLGVRRCNCLEKRDKNPFLLIKEGDQFG